MPHVKKRFARGKKVPVNVLKAPLDNVSFHSIEVLRNGSLYIKEG